MCLTCSGRHKVYISSTYILHGVVVVCYLKQATHAAHGTPQRTGVIGEFGGDRVVVASWGGGGRVCEVRTISLSIVVGIYCGFGHRNYQRISRPVRSSIRNCLIERRDPSTTQAPSFRTRPGWLCCRLADQFPTLGHLCSSVGSVTVTTNASRHPLVWRAITDRPQVLYLIILSPAGR